MAYAFVTKITGVKKHSNADNLNIGYCFDNQVIVSLNTQEGDIGVYFPTDVQLDMDYCIKNNLLRVKNEDGTNGGGFLEPEKRAIKTLKLRGEISDGLFMPLTSLATFTNIETLFVGDCVDVLSGVVIAQKYIPAQKQVVQVTAKNGKVKLVKKTTYPLFQEHIDTAQYSYNKHAFKEGDIITLSLKMHGTSARVANTIAITKTPKTLLNKVLIALKLMQSETYEHKVVSGTRRVVLDSFDGGFYGSNNFRKRYHDLFANKLQSNETVYFEIVGYEDSGRPIMSTCVNSKVGDKKFVKQYGETTTFTYGCEPSQNDIYVYRMCYTSPTGEVYEYPTWLVKQRCEEMGVKFVPVFEQFVFTTIENLDERIAEYIDGSDPVGLTHIREGVVIRIENRKKFTAYKAKSVYFKILEGIIKDSGITETEDLESLE